MIFFSPSLRLRIINALDKWKFTRDILCITTLNKKDILELNVEACLDKALIKCFEWHKLQYGVWLRRTIVGTYEHSMEWNSVHLSPSHLKSFLFNNCDKHMLHCQLLICVRETFSQNCRIWESIYKMSCIENCTWNMSFYVSVI